MWVKHKTRVSDGARLQCPDHPDAPMEQGPTPAGNIRTWCLAPGCNQAAQWVVADARTETDDD